MLQFWRRQLQQVRDAATGGRLDDAARLLLGDKLIDYQGGRPLAAKVAQALTERSAARLERGDTSAGWHDLDLATQLAGADDGRQALQSAWLAAAVTEVRDLLDAGLADAALRRLTTLDARHGSALPLRQLRTAAQCVQRGLAQATQGNFRQATLELEAAMHVTSDLPGLAARRVAWRRDAEQLDKLCEALNAAVVERRWADVMTLAEQTLQIAPGCTLAQSAQRRAAEGLELVRSPPDLPIANNRPRLELPHSQPASRPIAMPTDQRGPRRLLWVDGVGGFLICLGDQAVIGQPQPGVDVPILADLSRQHATLARDGEHYLLHPHRKVSLDGRPLDGSAVVRDGQQITLGDSVRLLLRRPHRLSCTAILELVSRHRTQPAVDGIVLLAEALMLGPGSQQHIRCDAWLESVVLFRRGHDLGLRAAGTFTVDGVTCQGHAMLSPNARVVGQNFSFAIEAV